MTAAYQDGQTDTDLIAEIRRDISDADRCNSMHISPATQQLLRSLRKAADALEISNAEVSALREVIEKAKADAWDEGFAAADINRPRSRKGHWEETRHGVRTWIPDPLPVNPYAPAVASPEGSTE